MVHTWLRDAVLAGLLILGLAFGLEHASEVEAVGRKLVHQAQTALKTVRPAPRPAPPRFVATASARPAPSAATTRRPPTPVVKIPESRPRVSVRIVPPIPTAPRRMNSYYPDRWVHACGWQWIPVANCNRW